MPEANPAPILSNSPSRYPRIAPVSAQEPKLLDRLCEALRSRHYSRILDFCHGLFHLTHVDLLGREIPSALGDFVAIKKAPSFPRKRESRESKFGPFRNSWATMM